MSEKILKKYDKKIHLVNMFLLLRKTKYSLLVIFSIVFFSACKEKRVIKTGNLSKVIDGIWEFRQAGKKDWKTASVPGCVHTDLLKNEMIDDPFVGENEKKLQWIEREDWEYRTTFKIDENTAGYDNIELFFEGLDTYASIYLNDSLLFKADNMFTGWKISCKNIIRPGKNDLRIYFHSPINKEMPEISKMNYQLPVQYDQTKHLKVSPFVRKAQYHFGSDFGPRLVTFGIWKPIHLQAWNTAKINNIQIIQKSLTDKKAVLTAKFEIQADIEANASIVILSRDSLFKTTLDSFLIKSGTNSLSIDFEINNPKKWWTNGLGESYLYNIFGELKINNSIADTLGQNIGLRTIEVVSEKDSIGKTLYFKLNGTSIFIKGANYLPADNFINRVSPEKYADLILSAKEANMNMLRINGSGVYENELFYDLCDKNGILIWQDFMFSNSLYPGDSGFIKNVKHEIEYNIKRLRNHPSLAVWCGNNEIETNWYKNNWKIPVNYTYDDSIKLSRDYSTLFNKIIPEEVKKSDNRFYLPSSPKFYYTEPESLTNSDSHYWGVWQKGKPVSEYTKNTSRFISEYGFQSFPEMNTIRSFIKEESDLDLSSSVMASHQKYPDGNEIINTYLKNYYKAPKDLSSYVYLSQLIQSEAVKTAIESHRRKKPYCMGTLYLQLDDSWPGITFSGIDYYGNWKAAHYIVKKAYSSVMVSSVEEDEKLKIYIVSDYLKTINATLNINLYDFSGKNLFREEISVQIPANSSKVYFESAEWKKYLRGKNMNSLVLETTIAKQEGDFLSKNLYYFSKPKDLNLPPTTKLKIDITKKEDGFLLEISSPKFQKNTYLKMKDIKGRFSDNYFDLLPNEKIEVFFYPQQKGLTIEDITKNIISQSLSGTYR